MKSLVLALLLAPVALFAQAAAPETGGEKAKDPSLAAITDTPGLPRVLLIGDSISMGYTLPVRTMLAGKANVHRIPENGGSTRDGLLKLKRWLGDGKWDAIHFNWGLHDLKHWKDGKLDLAGPQVTNVEDYEKNLRSLVTQLQATGAKLVWASTTPVPAGSGGRVAGDEVGYNAAAARVMSDAGIPVNDLHAFASVRLAEIQRPANVHFSTPGSQALAERVAATITVRLLAR